MSAVCSFFRLSVVLFEQNAIMDTFLSSASQTLSFYLNGTPIHLTNPHPRWTLLDFIRSQDGLKGTKLGCGEGGCGACTVVLQTRDASRRIRHVAVNACLYPLVGGTPRPRPRPLSLVQGNTDKETSHRKTCHHSGRAGNRRQPASAPRENRKAARVAVRILYTGDCHVAVRYYPQCIRPCDWTVPALGAGYRGERTS